MGARPGRALKPGPAVSGMPGGGTVRAQGSRNLRRLDIVRSRRPALRRRRPIRPHGGGHVERQEVRERTLFSKYIENIKKVKRAFAQTAAGPSLPVRRRTGRVPSR